MSDLFAIVAWYREQRSTCPPFLALKVGEEIGVMFFGWAFIHLGDSGC